MAEKKPSLITPEFRVNFPRVFEAKMNELSKKLEYSVVAVFPPGADLTKLKSAAAAAIKGKWGEKKPMKLKSPFRDQGERETEEGNLPDGYVKGAIFINLKSTRQPGVINRKKEPIIDAEEFYSGCYALASVNCSAWDHPIGGKGVSFWLNNLQKTRDGEPLSGRPKAEDEFQAIEGADEEVATADDPFGS